ncbi:metalloregulator ArsR/SmtB family transcription factor [Nocardia sp. CC227C]|uniref:helix-turn-helix domain-containing GNAT family N-acetyltransferase n=1 Tax=Nocardia sp. CC227C TaxID=3044562 RepID=UPI00278C2ADC|nr:metalloregulator ArsR/SmtB family transcription factor [Nocardia sp. CC227C]
MTTAVPPVPSERSADALSAEDAATFAVWFACLADPTRVRLLHHVALHPAGVSVGDLAAALGIRQPTVSHHVRKLADVGFVTAHRRGTSTVVAVNPACCTGLPHAADAVMGLLPPPRCCPDDIPDDVTVRPLHDADVSAVRRIAEEWVASGAAGTDVTTADIRIPDPTWLPDHRWVAAADDRVAGFAALTPVATGVARTSICVAADMRGRGVGKALLRAQVDAADAAGLWTLESSIPSDNRAGIGLLHTAAFRTVGVRDRLLRTDSGFRDVVLLERRSFASSDGQLRPARPEPCAK